MTQKIALITGANKGIGYETARRLGELGMTVLVGARDEERGEEAEAALRDGGADARFLPLDVTDAESIARAADTIDREFGRLDVLVNNAGTATVSRRRATASETSAGRRSVRRALGVPVAIRPRGRLRRAALVARCHAP